MFTPQLRNLFPQEDIQDLKNIPQSGEIFARLAEHFQTNQVSNFERYHQEFYAPWLGRVEQISAEQILTNFTASKNKFAENFAIYIEEWYQLLLKNAQLDKIYSLNMPAVVVNNCSLRNMPTIKPAFYDPKLPGEGYPFDSIQENLLYIGEAVLISHFTIDKEFALVITNAKNYGFIESKNLGFVSPEDIQLLLSSPYGIIANDQLKTYLGSNFHTSLSLGSYIAIRQKNDQSVTIYLPTRNDEGNLRLVTTEIALVDIICSPLIFNDHNLAKFINMTISHPYGWGGYLNNRDCAQLLKDYFALFAIHIPIFSAKQIKTGHYISLEDLTNEQKMEIIQKEGLKFRTILYRKGHVTLYLGIYNNQMIMYHQVWGIYLYDLSGNEYRHILGKAVITSLEYGKELAGFDAEKSNFLSRMTAMTVL